MRRRRAIPSTITATFTATLAAAALIGGFGGPVGAASDDDGEKSSQLAEAQFRVYLLTHTELVPADITCTRPPTQNTDGEMLCFALVNGRDTVAAVATLESPGAYTFTAIAKVDAVETSQQTAPAPQPAPLPEPAPAPEPAPEPVPQNEADQAVLDAVDDAVSDIEGLSAFLTEEDDMIVSVDLLDYDAPTVTVQVSVTTSATDPSVRDSLAFFVTDTMAYLWQDDQPLRDEAATIHPRLEVTVDGVIYGTPYDVMVGVADYEIEFEEWLAISTGAAAYKSASLGISEARRSESKPVHAVRALTV